MGNTDITKHNAVASAKKGTTRQKQVPQTPNKQTQLNPNAILVGKCTKFAGTEPMRQMTPGNANVSSLSEQTKLANNPYLPRRPKQKTEVAAPTLWGKSRREGVHHRRPPNRYEEDFFTECNEEPTQDWQRRWNVGMILRHKARHPDDPTPLPQWITESPDNYATLKRPLPESKTERIYIYDRDYR